MDHESVFGVYAAFSIIMAIVLMSIAFINAGKS